MANTMAKRYLRCVLCAPHHNCPDRIDRRRRKRKGAPRTGNIILLLPAGCAPEMSTEPLPFSCSNGWMRGTHTHTHTVRHRVRKHAECAIMMRFSVVPYGTYLPGKARNGLEIANQLAPFACLSACTRRHGRFQISDEKYSFYNNLLCDYAFKYWRWQASARYGATTATFWPDRLNAARSAALALDGVTRWQQKH